MPIKGDYKQYTDPEEQAKMFANFWEGFFKSSKISFSFIIIKGFFSWTLEVFSLFPVLFQWILVYYLLKKLLN